MSETLELCDYRTGDAQFRRASVFLSAAGAFRPRSDGRVEEAVRSFEHVIAVTPPTTAAACSSHITAALVERCLAEA